MLARLFASPGDLSDFCIIDKDNLQHYIESAVFQRNHSLLQASDLSGRIASLEKKMEDMLNCLETAPHEKSPSDSHNYVQLLDAHLRDCDKLVRLQALRSQHSLHASVCSTLEQVFTTSDPEPEKDKPYIFVPKIAGYFVHRLTHPIYRPKKRTRSGEIVYFLWTEDLGISLRKKSIHAEYNGKITRTTREMGTYRTRKSTFRTDWMSPKQALEFQRAYFIESEKGTISPGFWRWQEVINRPSASVPFQFEVAALMQKGFFPNGTGIGAAAFQRNQGGVDEAPIFCAGRTDDEPLDEFWAFLAQSEEALPSSCSFLNSFVGPRMFFFGPVNEEEYRQPTTFLPVVAEHANGLRIYPYTRNPRTLDFYASCKFFRVRSAEGRNTSFNGLDSEQAQENLKFEAVGIHNCSGFLASRESAVEMVLKSRSLALNVSDFYRQATDRSNHWQVLPPPAEMALQLGPPSSILPRRIFVSDDSQLLVVGTENPSLQEIDTDFERKETVAPLSRTSRPPLVFWDKHDNRVRWSLEDLHFYLLPVNSRNEGILDQEKSRFPSALLHHPHHFNHVKWGGKIHRSTLVEIANPNLLFEIDNGAAIAPPKKLTTCAFVSLCLKYVFKHVKAIWDAVEKYQNSSLNCSFEYLSQNIKLSFLGDSFRHCKAGNMFDISDQPFVKVFSQNGSVKVLDKHSHQGVCNCHTLCATGIRSKEFFVVLELLDAKLKETLKSDAALGYFKTNYKSNLN